jgi:hypothetical protein
LLFCKSFGLALCCSSQICEIPQCSISQICKRKNVRKL